MYRLLLRDRFEIHFHIKIIACITELPSQDLELESDEEDDQNDKDWSADLPSASEEEYEYRYENDNPYIEMMEELRNSNQTNTTPRLVLVTDREPSNSNQGIETVDLEEEQLSESVTRRPSGFTRKHSGGREKSRIWEEFTEVNDKTWKCKHCAHVYKHPQANRLQKHLNKCSKRKSRANLPTFVPVSTSSDVLGCPVSEVQKPSTSQRTLEQCTPRTSSQLKHQMDEALLKMICSTNASFNMVENKEFKAFINLARGSYEVPTRKYIGDTMLEKVYNKEMLKFSSFVKRKRATILQDGWKAPQGECVIAHSLTIEGRNYFFNSHVMGEEKKTSENCLRLLIQAIEKAESMGVHVTSCVTDNCASMKLMREMLKVKRPTILTYGCNSHLLNLIGKKITPEELMQKVVLVQKYVSNHDITKAALKNIRGLSPVLPTDTRWNSQLSCLENYYKNHAKYLEISRREDIPISNTVLNIVENQSVVPEVKGLINILKPVALSLDMVIGFTILD
ncbi:unnamed protein product [Orchesella dallaii]|uniref:BED-type domain-containing protein n=1 Tax=Orchesella dallaii TaxID=48710 RepID=A0ABP1Q844_9HEXA